MSASSTKPLHIGLLMHSVLPRGGVIHALELAHALLRRGHAVSVIASAAPGEELFRSVETELDVIRLPRLGGALVDQVRQRIASLADALPRLLRPGRFDLVHAHDSISGNALASVRQAGGLSAPWLRTVHHLDTFSAPELNAWQERAWREADGLACVSDAWCQHFEQVHGLLAERMFNGVDGRRFRAQAEPGEADWLASRGLALGTGPVCLIVGGVEERKNTLRLLQAFSRLRREDPEWRDARLVVAGGASMLDHGSAHQAWRNTLDRLELNEGPGEPVWRTGPLPDEAIPALMRRATVLAMPSIVEGFGLAALEALACGTPVLVSQRHPFTEHLSDSPGVAWCDPLEVDSIAAGLRRAARWPRLVEVPAVCLAHDWDRSAATHEGWYRRALDVSHPGHPAQLDRQLLNVE